MDLLLYLVRRQELEAGEIPISRIADQYLEHIEGIEDVDVNLAGDFLVMAATLMEVKSRELLPQEDLDALDDEEDEDPSAELVQRLLQFKRFKDLSRRLGDASGRRDLMFSRPEHVIRIPKEWLEEELKNLDPLEGVTLWDLLNAYVKVIQTAKPVVQAKVTYEDVPLPIFFHRITGLLQQKSPRPLQELFTKLERGHVIGTFLALLELVRLKKVTVVQTEDYGPIWVQWVAGASLSEEEVEEARVSLGDQPQEAPSYEGRLDLVSRSPEDALAEAEPVDEAGAQAADVHIETLRSRHVAHHSEPLDASITPLPGFVPVEMPLSEGVSDQASTPISRATEEDGLVEFAEEDEIDRALAAVQIPEVETGNILGYRMEVIEEQPPPAPAESVPLSQPDN
jgi:segregation and condensation protein A